MYELYNKDVEDFITLSNLPQDQILDIEFHPLNEVLLDFYIYNKNNINRYSKHFELTKTFFLYHSTRMENAVVQSYDKCNVIFITNGLFTKSYEILITLNKDFDRIAFSQYQNLNKNIKYSLGKLMFESSMIFTFYHEFAHLIHKKGEVFEMSESFVNNSEFDQYRHILEYDSDLCGCNFVIGLIDQYILDHSDNFKTQHDVVNLHWLGLSSIIITMLMLLNNYENGIPDRTFYTKERIHPHQSIRIQYMLEHYLFNMKEFGIQVGIQDGLNNCFRYCNEFFEKKDIFEHYFEQISINRSAINHYCDELYNLSIETPNLVRHQIKKFDLNSF